jgi:hypothetical protein
VPAPRPGQEWLWEQDEELSLVGLATYAEVVPVGVSELDNPVQESAVRSKISSDWTSGFS